MIDVKTGKVCLEDVSYSFEAGLTVDRFKQSALYDGGDVEHGYLLKEMHEIYNKMFFVSLYFLSGFLNSIHLSEDTPGESWIDWSLDIEMKKKKNHDEWLESMLGLPPYDYQWGHIVSVFDRKGGESIIVIRYI